MRSILFLPLGLLAVGCEKTTKPGPEPRTQSSTSTPTPATSKSGAAPDDPMLANVPPAPMPPDAVTKPLARGSNAFAFDLWQKVSAKESKNLTFSPASVTLALAMTYGGAKGATATQMEKTLHFTDPSGVSTGWGAFTKALTSPGRPMKLRIANRLYAEQTYKLDQGFLHKTKTSFGSGVELVDFKTKSEPTRGQINKWVEDVTEKRIKDLLPPPAVNPDTRLVLVNAIYFLADWEYQFEKTGTHDAEFSTSATVKKKVPTMHESGHQYRIAQGDGARILELPYKGKSASMVFVLPDKVDGLAAVEKSLDATKLEKWIGALASPKEKVVIALPRFEIAPPTIPLADHLSSLGMKDAFDPKQADFSGMSGEKGFAIGAVVHKAFVKVDEKGTEAAAATAVAMAGAGVDMSKPIEFFLDHPFLFFIVDRDSGLILFMGRVSDPSATS